MKNYLTYSLLFHLLQSEKKNRKLIEEKLKERLKSGDRFFSDSHSISELIHNGLEYSQEIFHSIHGLCDQILLFTKEDVSIAIGLQKELKISYMEALSLAISTHNQLDRILGYGENLSSQKLISFLDLSPKSK